MSNISIEIGKKIRNFRKMKKMTIEELAEKIGKSKSTVSKYEKAEVIIDIEILYSIADVLQIQIEELLYNKPRLTPMSTEKNPAFFTDISQFYSYGFDGRINRISRCVLDLFSEIEPNKREIIMYMNYSDFENYQNCETTYYGYIEHFDAVTNIQLTNRDTPMEKASVQILASYLDSDIKWGLFNGFSSRPMMPVASKRLFSKTRLKEDEELIKKLKISKDDIRLLKLYNMFSVT